MGLALLAEVMVHEVGGAATLVLILVRTKAKVSIDDLVITTAALDDTYLCNYL